MTTETAARRAYVWDPLVRIAHWTLVAAFATAYVTGEEESLIHVYAGYCIAALIAWRMLWGLIGPRSARFASFVRSPRAAIEYVRGLATGRAERHLGHNPAGGWMVLLLLAGLALTCVSGLKVYGLEGHGPLAVVANPAVTRALAPAERKAARRARHRAEERWEEVHEVAANLTLLLVGVHVLGVFASSLRHRENLPWSMVTGYKRRSDAEPGGGPPEVPHVARPTGA